MQENDDVTPCEAQEIVNRVRFELKRMIGNNCIDYGKLLAMLDGKL